MLGPPGCRDYGEQNLDFRYKHLPYFKRQHAAGLRQRVTSDGDIDDVCGSTDIGDLNYYLKRPRLQGDRHGFGPLLLAGSEIRRLAPAPTGR